MYAQQSSIDPSLAALLQTAKMVTPDQTPTVAAQVAQAAQQKMQPQGIMQGMQGAKQDYAAAQPSMMRNMQQQQVQQMMQQAMQPKPAGIEGLPAQNMQGMQQMARGGVVGYAEGGTPRTYGSAPDYESARSMGINLSPYDSPEDRQKKLERLQKMREFEEQRKSFGDIPTEETVARDAALQAAYPGKNRDLDVIRQVQPGRTAAPPMAASPEGQRLAQAQSMPTQFNVGVGAIPALRRAAQMVGGKEREDILNKITELEASAPSATPQAAPQGGIAALPAAPTFGAAMKEAEQALPGTGTEQNRAELQRLQEMRRARPDTGQMTSKALEEEGGVAAALKAKLDQSAQERGIMSWLMGGEGRGASARSYEGFRRAEDQRQILQAQENTIRVAKIEAIKEANEARKIGDQEGYVNALNKLSELERADKQVKATLAANIFQTQTSIRNQDVQAATSEASRRATEDIRKMTPADQIMAENAINDWLSKNPGKSYSDGVEWYKTIGQRTPPTDRSVITYDQAADNVTKFMDSMPGMQEIGAIQKRAKDAGQPVPSMAQIREALIRREMEGGGRTPVSSAPAGGQAPPPVGTVMQGYRFKGGNPADKNNWEKV